MYTAIILQVLKLGITITTCITQAFMCSIWLFLSHSCMQAYISNNSDHINFNSFKAQKTSMFASEINKSKRFLIQEWETFL